MSILSYCFCFPREPALQINGQSFKIEKLLGEGGFSYVYLVSASNGAQYALKKIRCPFGAESVRLAMTEVQNYKEFKSPYIIRAIDSSVVQEEDGSKTVYILLPMFDTSLQDIINKNVVNGTHIEEKEAIRIFIGICRGLASMHKHQKYSSTRATNIVNSDDDSTNETEHLLTSDSEIDTLPDIINSDPDVTELSDIIAYAHKDLKPANVMLSKDGLPVLCDLGSCSKARSTAKTRSAAVAIQELAAEHCTLPFRAPELLDVKTGAKIDEKIDIWSLGCLLYALLYGCSPFEYEEMENGASINLAISSGKWEFPKKNDVYGDEIKSLIKQCLVVDPEERSDVETVLSHALLIQNSL